METRENYEPTEEEKDLSRKYIDKLIGNALIMVPSSDRRNILAGVVLGPVVGFALGASVLYCDSFGVDLCAFAIYAVWVVPWLLDKAGLAILGRYAEISTVRQALADIDSRKNSVDVPPEE